LLDCSYYNTILNVMQKLQTKLNKALQTKLNKAMCMG
jgi:hypothetical protein